MSGYSRTTRVTARAATAVRSERQESRESLGSSEWHEPAYFAHPGPSRSRQVAAGFAIFLFVAAPLALLIALVAQ